MRVRVLLCLGVAVLLSACHPEASAPTLTASPATAQAAPAAARPAPAMTRVRAGRGETCSQYVRWCVEWCTKNMPGSPGCLTGCQQRGDTCGQDREWVIESESKIVFGLPKR